MRSRHQHLDVDSIKETIDPHDFYLREQGLHRFGYRSGKWALAGLCPFHDDTSAGSFKVNLQMGAYTCFSCGAKGGDIINFTQKKYGLSFKEALQKLQYEWRVS